MWRKEKAQRRPVLLANLALPGSIRFGPARIPKKYQHFPSFRRMSTTLLLRTFYSAIS
jgi:hypothetical protein